MTDQKQLSNLTDLLTNFCSQQKLPLMSADDLLYGSYDHDLSIYQKDWLRQFIELWDTTERGES